MQRSALAKNDSQNEEVEMEEEESTSRFDAIREQIATIAQNKRIQIQKLRFSTDRVENGIAIDFALRLVVLSDNDNNGYHAEH